MKSKLLLIGLVAVTLMTLTACTSNAKEVSVNESSSGKQVEIAVDGTLIVTLESNSTTGYSWELKNIVDTTILQKIGNVYLAPTTTLVGAGGKEVWNFKALKAGTTTLTMEYNRPWESDSPAAESFTLTVVVK
jgi:inhibitor of cysteine peptidase